MVHSSWKLHLEIGYKEPFYHELSSMNYELKNHFDFLKKNIDNQIKNNILLRKSKLP